MKWHTGLDAAVTLVLVVAVLALAAVALGGCTAQAPGLGVECEAAGDPAKSGLWCSKRPPQASGSTPIPETSVSPPARLARRGSELK